MECEEKFCACLLDMSWGGSGVVAAGGEEEVIAVDEEVESSHGAQFLRACTGSSGGGNRGTTPRLRGRMRLRSGLVWLI